MRKYLVVELLLILFVTYQSLGGFLLEIFFMTLKIKLCSSNLGVRRTCTPSLKPFLCWGWRKFITSLTAVFLWWLLNFCRNSTIFEWRFCLALFSALHEAQIMTATREDGEEPHKQVAVVLADSVCMPFSPSQKGIRSLNEPAGLVALSLVQLDKLKKPCLFMVQ